MVQLLDGDKINLCSYPKKNHSCNNFSVNKLYEKEPCVNVFSSNMGKMTLLTTYYESFFSVIKMTPPPTTYTNTV